MGWAILGELETCVSGLAGWHLDIAAQKEPALTPYRMAIHRNDDERPEQEKFEGLDDMASRLLRDARRSIRRVRDPCAPCTEE